MSFRHTWTWLNEEEVLYRSLCVGKVLHVCSGKSSLGNIKVDLFVKADIKADVRHLPFRPLSFDAVICDPPFKLYHRFKWILKLKNLARIRLILITPNYLLRFPDFNITSVLIIENKSEPSKNTTFKRCFTCKLCWVYDRTKNLKKEWLQNSNVPLENWML